MIWIYLNRYPQSYIFFSSNKKKSPLAIQIESITFTSANGELG